MHQSFKLQFINRSPATIPATSMMTTPTRRRKSRSRSRASQRLTFGSRSQGDFPPERNSNERMNLPAKKLTDLRRRVIMEYLAQRPHPFATDLTGPNSLREIGERLRKRNSFTGRCNEDDIRYWLGMSEFERDIKDAAQSGGVLEDQGESGGEEDLGDSKGEDQSGTGEAVEVQSGAGRSLEDQSGAEGAMEDQSGAEGAMEDQSAAEETMEDQSRTGVVEDQDVSGGVVEDQDGSGGVLEGQDVPGKFVEREEGPNLLPHLEESAEDPEKQRKLRALIQIVVRETVTAMNSFYSQGQPTSDRGPGVNSPPSNQAEPSDDNRPTTRQFDGTMLHVLPQTVPVSVAMRLMEEEEGIGEEERVRNDRNREEPIVEMDVPVMEQ